MQQYENTGERLSGYILHHQDLVQKTSALVSRYESFATVGEIRVWWRADFQSDSRVLKKVF